MYEKPYHSVDLGQLSFLVTGGAGFIGSNLAEYLIKYDAKKVRVLDNLITGNYDNIKLFEKSASFEFINGDIRNPEDCEKACTDIDFVLHQAALGSVPRSIKDPLTSHEINAVGFLNMLEASKNASVKRFVYASSSSVYGDNTDLPKQEGNIGTPLSPYAVTKRSNELHAQVYATIYGMQIIGLRYFNIFGPRQGPNGPYAAVIPLFIRANLNGDTVYIDGDGLQTRDFTFVENAVQANIKAAFVDNAVNDIYNIACGKSASVLDLHNMINELHGSVSKAEHREAREGDVRNSFADISKARSQLNYSPEISMKEGLGILMMQLQEDNASLSKG